MGFQIRYEIDGKVKKPMFSSYYECIKQKEKLRSQGIKVEWIKNEVYVQPDRGGSLDKLRGHSAISNFLDMCNNIEDYRNEKTGVKKSKWTFTN